MTYKDNAVKDLRIAYIGGGSRGWAWTFMRDLALEPALGGTIVLYDIDKEAAKANEIIGNGISEREEAVGKWKYIVADTLKEALTGSDFVVISILPGTFDEMESDVHEPEKYGIYQSVGDTAGPGGMVRALRTIPMFVTIAEAIRDYNVSAQKTPAVRRNVRGMNAPITNNATIIPTGFSFGIVGFSWPDVLQNAVIRCIALLFQEKHFR